MRINKTLIRSVSCFALITVFYASAGGQGTDSRVSVRSGYNRSFYIGFSIMPKTGGINNGSIPELDIKNKKGSSVDFSAEGGFFFSDMLGVSFGVGLSSYSSVLSLENYTSSFNTRDDEGEDYTMHINGKKISEDQKVSFMSLPLCLVFRYPAAEKLSFFISGGVIVNIPVVKSYESKGTFTYKGYYPAYPVTLENVPPGGFYNDKATAANGDLQVKSIVASLTASAGLSLYLSKAVQLTLAGSLNKAGNISGYPANNSFTLTSGADDMKSFMIAGKSAGIQSFGVNAGIRYYIR